MLTQLTKEHVPLLRAWLQDASMAEFFRRYPPSTAWLADDALLGAVGLLYAIEVDGHAVGLVNVSNVDSQARRAEVGVMVVEDCADRSGVARAALVDVGRYLFDFAGMHKVQAYVLPHREELRHMLQGAGFQHDGRLRAHTFFNGKFHDEDVWSLLAADFKALQAPKEK